MKLYPYQVEGAHFMADRVAAYLGDEMGLGKSAQAIAACDLVRAKSVLALCPAVALTNWMREFRRFQTTHRRVVGISSGSDARATEGVTICSYDLAARQEVHAILMQLRPDVLILDEAHYLKGRKTHRTQAVFGPECDRMGGLAEGAKRVFALSGTPAPNNPAELWPLMRALFPKSITRDGNIMDYWTFLRRFCIWREGMHGTRITGGRNLAELRARLAPHLLRRRKTEVLKDLPPIRFETVTLHPQGPLLDLWQAEDGPEGDELKKLLEQDDADLAEAAVHVAKLRRLTGLAKVASVVELLQDELAGGLNKIVVFAHHREVIQKLADGLSSFGVVVLQGSTPPTQRQAAIDGFQNDPAIRVFVGQLTAAGTAITLTAASNVLFAESSWTPSDNAQAAMRVHRIGQRSGVLVRFATLSGSLDEAITETVRRKTAVLAQIFD